jgi:hypothetical protein
MLQHLHLNGISIAADIKNLITDRLRVNQLALNVPAWVAYAVARLTAVPGHLGVPPSFAECAAMLAFGDELLEPDDNFKWRTPGGRESAAAYLLPLAEAALRPRCSGWPARLLAVPGPRSIASSAPTSRDRAANELILLSQASLSDPDQSLLLCRRSSPASPAQVPARLHKPCCRVAVCSFPLPASHYK